MRSIRGSLSHHQALIEVSVAHPENELSRETVWALIDTGATRTCLSEDLIARFDLPARTKLIVASARSGPERRRAYGFSLGLFCQQQPERDGPSLLYVFPGEVISPAFVSSGNFDVLIGVDLLSIGRFILDRQEFTFEF